MTMKVTIIFRGIVHPGVEGTTCATYITDNKLYIDEVAKAIKKHNIPYKAIKAILFEEEIYD